MRVLLIGFNESVLAALDRSFPPGSVVVVEEPDLWESKQLAPKAAKHACLAEVRFGRYQQDDEYIEVVAGLDVVDAVAPGMEYAVPAAARAAEALGLPGAGVRAADLLRDKLLLREATTATMTTPRFREVHGPEDIATFAQGAPCVVKPSGRQASLGVVLLDAEADVEQAWRECRGAEEGHQIARRPMAWRYMAEERLRGAEYSTECLVRAGEIVFLNVTAKRTAPGRHPVELGHVVPGWPFADPAAPWRRATQDLIDAIGFGTGMLHAEWILTDTGPVLVECAGRPPGDRIMDLVDLAYDTNIADRWLRLLAGRPAEIDPRPARGAAIRFLVPPVGVLRRVAGVADVEGAPGVWRVQVSCAPGHTTSGLASSWDRAGWVLTVAATAEDAERLAADAASRIRLEAAPADPAPATAPDAQPAELRLSGSRTEEETVLPSNRLSTRPAHPVPDFGGETLLVLGSAGLSKRGIFEAAKSRRLRVVLAKSGATWEKEYCDAVLGVDCAHYEDFDTVVRAVTDFARRQGAGGVVTTADAGMPVLAAVAAVAGLAGPSPEVVGALRSKVRMRERFAELGLPSAASVAVSTHGTAVAAGAQIGYPVILKPAVGTGSAGVLLARDAAELREAYTTARRAALNIGRNPGVVVEEFLEGVEVCVDAVVHEGQILFHNVMDKPRPMTGPLFEELEFVTPTSLSGDGLSAAYDVSSLTVGRLGLGTGIAHTEMRMTSGGPRLIETHFRVPGQRLPDIIERALGVNLFGAAVDLAMGARPALVRRQAGFVGYRCVYSHRQGRLKAVRGLDSAAAIPGVFEVETVTHPGEEIRTLPERNQQNIAYILAEGPDHASVRRSLATAIELVSVDVA
jgi:biotin carboxylase